MITLKDVPKDGQSMGNGLGRKVSRLCFNLNLLLWVLGDKSRGWTKLDKRAKFGCILAESHL